MIDIWKQEKDFIRNRFVPNELTGGTTSGSQYTVFDGYRGNSYVMGGTNILPTNYIADIKKYNDWLVVHTIGYGIFIIDTWTNYQYVLNTTSTIPLYSNSIMKIEQHSLYKNLFYILYQTGIVDEYNILSNTIRQFNYQLLVSGAYTTLKQESNKLYIATSNGYIIHTLSFLNSGTTAILNIANQPLTGDALTAHNVVGRCIEYSNSVVYFGHAEGVWSYNETTQSGLTLSNITDDISSIVFDDTKSKLFIGKTSLTGLTYYNINTHTITDINGSSTALFPSNPIKFMSLQSSDNSLYVIPYWFPPYTDYGIWKYYINSNTSEFINSGTSTYLGAPLPHSLTTIYNYDNNLYATSNYHGYWTLTPQFSVAYPHLIVPPTDFDQIYFKYQKCFSGVCYTYISETTDIYQTNLQVSKSQHYLYNMYNEYDIMNEFCKNYTYVDLIVDYNIDTGITWNILDYTKLKPNHRLLLKNQTNSIENGTYIVNKTGYLDLTKELDTRDLSDKYKVWCKLGTYFDKQFNLQDFNALYFPITTESKTFFESNSYVLTHSLDYDTYTTVPKILISDYDIARKINNKNASLYDSLLIIPSGSTDRLESISIHYRDVVYSVNLIEDPTALAYVYEYTGTTNSTNVYNINGVTTFVCPSTFNVSVNDYIYIDFKNDSGTTILDFNTFVSVVGGGNTTFSIYDIIPNDILFQLVNWSGMTSSLDLTMNIRNNRYMAEVDYQNVISRSYFNQMLFIESNTGGTYIRPVDDIYKWFDFDSFHFSWTLTGTTTGVSYSDVLYTDNQYIKFRLQPFLYNIDTYFTSAISMYSQSYNSAITIDAGFDYFDKQFLKIYNSNSSLDFRDWYRPWTYLNTNNPTTPSITWATVAGGFDGYTTSFCIFNNELYVGGNFNSGGTTLTRNIAKLVGNTWIEVGGGFNNLTTSMCVFNNELYVGGAFTSGGTTLTKNIAKLSGNSWVEVGGGFNSLVNTLCVFNNELYVGGYFVSGGTNQTLRIAKLSGNTWVDVGGGFNSHVLTMIVYSGYTGYDELYVGGRFTSASGGTAIINPYIAKLSGNSWVEVDAIGGGFDNYVLSSYIYNGELYFGGDFVESFGGFTPLQHIAKYTGGTFAEIAGGFDNSVYSMCEFNGDLYANGLFITASGGTISLSKIAKLNNENWEDVYGGLILSPNSMIVYGNELYVGGILVTASGGTISVPGIAKLALTYTSSMIGTSLIYQVNETDMLIERPIDRTNGNRLSYTDCININSIENIYTLGDIDDILYSLYTDHLGTLNSTIGIGTSPSEAMPMGYSNYFIPEGNRTQQLVYSAYGEILSENTTIQNKCTGILMNDGDRFNLRLFENWSGDTALEYRPIEIAIIGADKKTRLPIPLY